MTSASGEPRRQRSLVYAAAIAGMGCLAAGFVLIGGLRFWTALAFAGFDTGAIGLLAVGSRPAWLGLSLRSFGLVHDLSFMLWVGTLLAPAMRLSGWLGVPEWVLGLSVTLALGLISTVTHAALFTPAEMAALRIRQTVSPD